MVCETHLTTYINLFLEAIISVSRGPFCREPYRVSNSLANVESTTYLNGNMLKLMFKLNDMFKRKDMLKLMFKHKDMLKLMFKRKDMLKRMFKRKDMLKRMFKRKDMLKRIMLIRCYYTHAC